MDPTGREDAVHVVVGGAIEALRCLTLHWTVSKSIHDVIHGRELALTPPLSPLAKFVPVMLDLRLVP